ncbi:MAG: sugar nucleotide-binding protein [Candidatus Eisenbacteria bacterium]|uniref:dTDP-4-dehydrorhamnose reductase n=1 Tax=Eiseniibacteriota bacterium TaxID=2212470 RepID=A0A9D6L851_UNCEI|nr:sugar nucleotide-binding protein [Candidatus Eisenbacteria bacterium]MBI3540361.1 sugar nucleotide-binding protein [Candidatus Eisenbacteria bacterium]
MSASRVLAAPVILGASGLVGGAFLAALRARGAAVRGTYRTQPGPGLDPLDLAGEGAAYLDSVAPSLVILTSALTHVDYCESHPEETHERNVRQLEPIVAWCGRAGVPLVFFSTDYLFDGREGPYDEDTAPHPLNVYGRSKLEGEALVRALGRHAVLRITNVFDIGFDVKNFLIRCLDHLRQRKPLIVPGDQLATPTYATWLAAETLDLLARGAIAAPGTPGVLHLGCDEMISRVDFATRVAAILGADASIVEGKPTAELHQAAPRPLMGGLRNDRLKRLLGVAAIRFDDALADLTPRLREAYRA